MGRTSGKNAAIIWWALCAALALDVLAAVVAAAMYGVWQPVGSWWFAILIVASAVLRRELGAASYSGGAAIMSVAAVYSLVAVLFGDLPWLGILVAGVVPLGLTIAMWVVSPSVDHTSEPLDLNDVPDADEEIQRDTDEPAPINPNAGFVWARAGDAATGASPANAGLGVPETPALPASNADPEMPPQRPAPDWGSL